MMKPLDGITVVDLSIYVTGAFATEMLASQGADVLKVERPGGGDPSRDAGPPFVDGESGYFMSLNYGKRSIELDLQDERGLEILYDLCSDADVFVENYRPGVAEKLGIGYEDIKRRNESIIYCSISGFGDSGPWSDRPGFDIIMQALSGIMDVTGDPDSRPMKVGLPQTDLITASWAAFGIMNGLFKRERTGEGDYFELAMFDAALTWLTKQAAKAFEGERPERMGTKDPVVAPYQVFEAADGYLAGGVPNEKLWNQLCEAIDRLDLLADERFTTLEDRVRNVDALESELEDTFTQRPVDEWLEILTEEYSLPFGPVLHVDEALECPQTEARGTITDLDHSKIGTYPVVNHPIQFERSASGFDRHAPVLGEHTDEILLEHGYDRDELNELYDADIIGSDSKHT